jgi:hypothetical protein
VESPDSPSLKSHPLCLCGRIAAVLTIVRMGRGRMMGVDHNQNMEWVGSSAAFYPG